MYLRSCSRNSLFFRQLTLLHDPASNRFTRPVRAFSNLFSSAGTSPLNRWYRRGQAPRGIHKRSDCAVVPKINEKWIALVYTCLYLLSFQHSITLLFPLGSKKPTTNTVTRTDRDSVDSTNDETPAARLDKPWRSVANLLPFACLYTYTYTVPHFSPYVYANRPTSIIDFCR